MRIRFWTQPGFPTPVPEPGYRFVGWAEADPTGYCVTGPVTFTAIFAPVAEASAFRDIKNHWAYEEICAVVESGLMFGVTQTAFVPNGAVTRAQAVTVLYRMFGEGQQPEGELPFADVPEDAWYYREMLWAYEAGIFQGVSEDRANPNGQLTREQFAALMYRALGAPDSDGTVGYGDAAQIHAWARDAVAYMSSCGMLQGYPGRQLPAPAHDYPGRAVLPAAWRHAASRLLMVRFYGLH